MYQLQYFTREDQLIRVTPLATVGSRVWTHNDVGTASITVPFSHPDFKYLIARGNWYRIRQKDTPTWVGQCVTRQWYDTYVQMSLKSAEWALKGKLTGQGKLFGAGGSVTAGQVAAELFYNAWQNSDLRPMSLGKASVFKRIFREYNYVDLYDAIVKLAQDTDAAFWVDADLTFNFAQQRGKDKTATVLLRENVHLNDVSIREDEEDVWTAVLGLSEGDKIIDKFKILRKIPEAPFFRARTLDVKGATSDEMLLEPVNSLLAKSANPRVTVDAMVLRGADDTFGDFWVGDTITLILVNSRFRKVTAQVMGVEVQEDDRLRCVFEVTQNLADDIVPWTVV